MKLATSLLALVISTRAYVVQRDLATIQGVLTNISNQVDTLDNLVKAFSGDATDLLAASRTIVSTINDGTTTVNAQPALDLTDASNIVPQVEALNTSVANTVADLASKKDALVAAGQGNAIFTALTDQKTASTALANALTSKVPTELQQVAAGLSAGITDSLQKGIDAFTGTGGGSSSSTPAGPTSSSPAGPTSSTPAGPTSWTPAGPTSSAPAGPSSSSIGGPTDVISSTPAGPSSTDCETSVSPTDTYPLPGASPTEISPPSEETYPPVEGTSPPSEETSPPSVETSPPEAAATSSAEAAPSAVAAASSSPVEVAPTAAATTSSPAVATGGAVVNGASGLLVIAAIAVYVL